MGHQRDEGDLPHVGALAGHVRPGDDEHPLAVAVHVGVVGHKALVLQGLLHHGMAAVEDVEGAVLGDGGPHVVVLHGGLGEGEQGVQLLQGCRRGLDVADFLRDAVAHLGEELALQPHALLLGADDALLDLLQLGGREALGVGQGLAAQVALGHHVQVGLGHLDHVAEHAVEADPQVADAGLLALALLQVQDPLLAVLGGGAELVEHGAVAVADDAALGDDHRRVRVDRPLQQIGEGLQAGRVEAVAQGLHRGALGLGEQAADAGHPLEGVAQREAVPRVEAAVADLREQALQVVHAAQLLREAAGEHPLAGELLHGAQARLDGVLALQGLLDPRAQQPSAHGGGGLVQQPEQGTLARMAAVALCQLKVAARAAVEEHGVLPLVDGDVGDVLQGVLLGLQQVAH